MCIILWKWCCGGKEIWPSPHPSSAELSVMVQISTEAGDLEFRPEQESELVLWAVCVEGHVAWRNGSYLGSGQEVRSPVLHSWGWICGLGTWIFPKLSGDCFNQGSVGLTAPERGDSNRGEANIWATHNWPHFREDVQKKGDGKSFLRREDCGACHRRRWEEPGFQWALLLY